MIKLVNIAKVFNKGTDTEVIAVKDVSLVVERRAWCNFIGPNGSGKTTILRILAGEIAPSAGSIFYQDENITTWPQWKRAQIFQYIEQDTMANLVPSMTVEENLLLAFNRTRFPRLQWAQKCDRREKILEMLTRFEMGLENRLSTQVRFLSGGQRQALVVARTLLTNVKILLLDEFVGDIDPKSAPVLLKLVKELAIERDVTVLAVTHDLEHVLLSGGRVLFVGSGWVTFDLPSGNGLSKEHLLELYSKSLYHTGKL